MNEKREFGMSEYPTWKELAAGVTFVVCLFVLFWLGMAAYG